MMNSGRKILSYADRVQVALIVFLQLTLVGASVWAIMREEWLSLFVSIFALVSTIIPFVFLKRRFGLVFPVEFQFAIVSFIYASLFLGEVGGYYERFWWWDMVLHGGSGFALGFAGFLILYTLYVAGKIVVGPFLFAVFTFCFALSMGTLWEIFEFTMDTFFGTNMQRLETGVVDTMLDLIIDSIGAFAAAVLAFEFVRYEKSGHKKTPHVFRYFVNRFFAANPWIVENTQRRG